MKRDWGDAAVSVVLLAVALIFFVEALTFDSASRLVPLSVLVPLVPLLSWCLARSMAQARRTPHAGPTLPATTSAGDARLIAWILALPLLATLAGAVAGPALFVAAWLRLRGGERWGAVVAAAGITAVAMAALMALLFATTPGDAARPVWLGS